MDMDIDMAVNHVKAYEYMVENGLIKDGTPVIFYDDETGTRINETPEKQMLDIVNSELAELQDDVKDVLHMKHVLTWKLSPCFVGDSDYAIKGDGLYYAAGTIGEVRAHINAYRQMLYYLA